MIALKQAGEAVTERKLRRKALLRDGPIFASALRFSFDEPSKDQGDADIIASKVKTKAPTKGKLGRRAQNVSETE
jgi:hypothetical protein